MKCLLLIPAIVALTAHGQSVPLEKPRNHGGFPSFVFLPDGQTVAGGTGSVTATINGKREKPMGGEVILWDAKTGRIRKTLGSHDASVRWIACSHDGTVLASASDKNGVVKIWDARNGSLRQTLKTANPIGTRNLEPFCALSPNGKLLAMGNVTVRTADELTVWDTSSGREVWKTKDSFAESLVITGDSTLLVAPTRKMQWQESPSGTKGTSSEESLVAWDLQTGKERWRSPLKPWPNNVVVVPGKGILAITGKYLSYFDPANGTKKSAIKAAASAGQRGMVVAQDGTRFAGFEFMGNHVDWVDLPSGKVAASQKFEKSNPSTSVISPDLKSAVMEIDFTPQIVTLTPVPVP
jgi:outer membrane protein assembly factor BamB